MRVFELIYPWQEQNFACFTDLHLDGSGHDRDLLLRDLQEAEELDADMIIGSEIFSGIIPKDLKRYTRGRDKKNVDAQLNMAVDEAFEIFTPYANRIRAIGSGNHDTALIKYHGFDPVLELIWKLKTVRDPELPNIIHMGFTGLFRIRFQNGNHVVSDDWWYHHGKGGGAPVTKGMIDINRVITTWDADVFWCGHKHTDISDSSLRKGYLDGRGSLKTKKRLAFFTAGYSGKIHVDDYNETGLLLDYSEESFYGLEGQGNAIVRYIPVYRDGGEDDLLRRQLIKGN